MAEPLIARQNLYFTIGQYRYFVLLNYTFTEGAKLPGPSQRDTQLNLLSTLKFTLSLTGCLPNRGFASNALELLRDWVR